MAQQLMKSMTFAPSTLSTSKSTRVTTPLRPTLPVRAPLRLATITQAKAAKDQVRSKGYDKNATTVDSAQPAFTRRREIIVGRTAMVGFLAATLGELLTGKGALGQLGLYTGAPSIIVDSAVWAVVLFSFIGAVAPWSPTWSDENQRDVAKRPSGPVQDAMDPFTEPKKYFGVTNFGFTKRNELFVGRVAMLGFASELIGEKLTGGRGPLGQIGVPLDLPLNSGLAGFGLLVWVGFFAAAAIGFGNTGSGPGQDEGDEGIY